LAPTKTLTLAANAPTKLTLNPTIPANLAEGNYYLLADVTVASPIGGFVLYRTTLSLPTPIHVDEKPAVAIAAPVSAADETPGQAAKFTLTREHSLSSSVAVALGVTGTAKRAKDYVLSTGNPLSAGGTALTGNSVTFSANVTSLDLFLNPIDDNAVESAESVIVTLKPGQYVIDPAKLSATATIADNEPTVTLALAQSSDGIASEAGTVGHITITRTGSTAQSLTVVLKRSGNATAGKDYLTFSLSVMIPAGQSSVVVNITPLTDRIAEATETVIVSLAPGKAKTPYLLGVDKSAIVTIADVASVSGPLSP